MLVRHNFFPPLRVTRLNSFVNDFVRSTLSQISPLNPLFRPFSRDHWRLFHAAPFTGGEKFALAKMLRM